MKIFNAKRAPGGMPKRSQGAPEVPDRTRKLSEDEVDGVADGVFQYYELDSDPSSHTYNPSGGEINLPRAPYRSLGAQDSKVMAF